MSIRGHAGIGIYRKKPVVVQAMKFNVYDLKWLQEFCPSLETLQDGIHIRFRFSTIEGDVYITEGDYLVKGVEGEFYPCKASIFDATHERIDGAAPAGTTFSVTPPSRRQ